MHPIFGLLILLFASVLFWYLADRLLTRSRNRKASARELAATLESLTREIVSLKESLRLQRESVSNVVIGQLKQADRLEQLDNLSRTSTNLIHQSLAKLDAQVLLKQDAQSEDERFMEEAKLSNVINRVASHAGRKAAEERVLPQIHQLTEDWLIKNIPTLEAVMRANFESIFKVTKRRAPIKVKLDTRNLNLGPEYKNLLVYMKPKNKAPKKPKALPKLDPDNGEASDE